MIKQVIAIRNDLNMRKGKMVAQGSHACLAAYREAASSARDIDRTHLSLWSRTGETKICVRVANEEELLSLLKKAREAKLPASLVIDAGRTEFNGVPTPTAVAIGPAPADAIDEITGKLELL